jgi:uncharacterized membrane protein
MARIAATALCLVILSLSPQARGQSPVGSKKTNAGPPQEVQDIEEVQVVSELAPAGSQASGLVLLGRMHPAVVHFPIAWVFLALLIETLSLITKRPEFSAAGFFVQCLAALSFIPAATSGWVRASAMGTNPEFLRLMVPHRNLNLAAGAIFFLAVALRIAGRNRWEGCLRLVNLALIAISTAFLMYAGHLGGKMVFGTEYLPF